LEVGSPAVELVAPVAPVPPLPPAPLSSSSSPPQPATAKAQTLNMAKAEMNRFMECS
jgi:hypothetical protein